MTKRKNLTASIAAELTARADSARANADAYLQQHGMDAIRAERNMLLTLNAFKNEAHDAARFAVSMNDSAYAEAVTRLELSAASMLALPTYARDKLHHTLTAIARGCGVTHATSRTNPNRFTAWLYNAIRTRGSIHARELVQAVKDDSRAHPGTVPTQTGSSRQMLACIGAIGQDELGMISITERGQELESVLGN